MWLTWLSTSKCSIITTENITMHIFIAIVDREREREICEDGWLIVKEAFIGSLIAMVLDLEYFISFTCLWKLGWWFVTVKPCVVQNDNYTYCKGQKMHI